MLARRTFLAALALLVSLPTLAFSYPDRPIKIVIGYAPGGTIDILARYVAEGLTQRTGQPVVVENKPGALGVLAAQQVGTAKPDGYTLLIAPDSAMAGNKFLIEKLAYDPERDFMPVATLALFEGFVLVVQSAQTPARTLSELTEFLKKKNGGALYGVPNNSALVLSEYYKTIAGFKGERINYRQSQETLRDILAGQMDFFFSDLATVASRIESGELRAIAIAAPSRAATLPNVPTMAESGMPGVELDPWQAVFLPANSPAEVRDQLGQWLNDIVAKDETKVMLRKFGAVPLVGGPKATEAKLQERLKLWQRLVEGSKVEKQQ